MASVSRRSRCVRLEEHLRSSFGEGEPIPVYSYKRGDCFLSAPGGPRAGIAKVYAQVEAAVRSRGYARQSYEEQKEHAPESSGVHSSEQTLQQLDVSCTHLKVLVPPSRGSSLDRSPHVLARNSPGCPSTFFIRLDLGGSFHTYPHLGGPYWSLKEAENAIDCHRRDLQNSTMYKESLSKLSPMERAVHKALYWPDGTRRKCFRRQEIHTSRDQTYQLVQALLDKYNEDHNLLGDSAFELKDVVRCQPICEGSVNEWYYHLNFTTKMKEADGLDCGIKILYFAEVRRGWQKGGYQEFELLCIRMIKPDDNGHCYGCKNNGSVDIKHPDDANAYACGHLDAYLPFGASDDRVRSDSDKDFEDEERRVRYMYKCLDDPAFLERLQKPRNTNTDGSAAIVLNTM